MIEGKFKVDFYDIQTKKAYRKGNIEKFEKERFQELVSLGVLEFEIEEDKNAQTIEIKTLKDKTPIYKKYPKGIVKK